MLTDWMQILQTGSFVFVPRRHAAAVFELLDRLESDGQATIPPDEPDGPAEVLGRIKDFDWTEPILRALHAKCRKIQRALITRPAQNAVMDTDASYGDLRDAGEQASGKPFSYDQTRANLGWISKYALAVTGKVVWPLEFADRGKEVPSAERYRYRMPKRIAEAWLRIVEEDQA
jgi:hypothetical protein